MSKLKFRDNVRDVVYVSGQPRSRSFLAYGIEFYEFERNVRQKLRRLLLLKHQFGGARFYLPAFFEYVTEAEMAELVQDDVYGYGDFCWVDFSREENLDLLKPHDVANLLYFAHMGKPLNRIFFPSLENAYAYYAHDDGFYHKVYARNVGDYLYMLGGVLADKATAFTGTAVPKIREREVLEPLQAAVHNGLFVNFERIRKDGEALEVPFAAVGHYRDMDRVYEMKEEIERYPLWLRCEQGRWKVRKG